MPGNCVAAEAAAETKYIKKSLLSRYIFLRERSEIKDVSLLIIKAQTLKVQEARESPASLFS